MSLKQLGTQSVSLSIYLISPSASEFWSKHDPTHKLTAIEAIELTSGLAEKLSLPFDPIIAEQVDFNFFRVVDFLRWQKILTFHLISNPLYNFSRVNLNLSFFFLICKRNSKKNNF